MKGKLDNNAVCGRIRGVPLVKVAAHRGTTVYKTDRREKKNIMKYWTRQRNTRKLDSHWWYFSTNEKCPHDKSRNRSMWDIIPLSRQEKGRKSSFLSSCVHLCLFSRHLWFRLYKPHWENCPHSMATLNQFYSIQNLLLPAQ